jgi:hypothetical protein
MQRFFLFERVWMSLFSIAILDPRDKSRGYSNLTPSEFCTGSFAGNLLKISSSLQAGEYNFQKNSRL